MIAEDFTLIEEIFSIIDTGIADSYESFRYLVEVGDGCIDSELIVEKNGVEIANVRMDFDDAILHSLIKRLRESAWQRGERWISFAITYRQGEQVKTSFKYNKN